MSIRKKVISALVKNDLEDWYSKEDMHDYFSHLLKSGFVGYENQESIDLIQEIKDRCIVNTKPSAECNTCNSDGRYICIECEHNQVIDYFEKEEVWSWLKESI
jgi:hypothetical protein